MTNAMTLDTFSNISDAALRAAVGLDFGMAQWAVVEHNSNSGALRVIQTTPSHILAPGMLNVAESRARRRGWSAATYRLVPPYC